MTKVKFVLLAVRASLFYSQINRFLANCCAEENEEEEQVEEKEGVDPEGREDDEDEEDEEGKVSIFSRLLGFGICFSQRFGLPGDFFRGGAGRVRERWVHSRRC